MYIYIVLQYKHVNCFTTHSFVLLFDFATKITQIAEPYCKWTNFKHSYPAPRGSNIMLLMDFNICAAGLLNGPPQKSKQPKRLSASRRFCIRLYQAPRLKRR